jgi:hypothetical protein
VEIRRRRITNHQSPVTNPPAEEEEVDNNEPNTSAPKTHAVEDPPKADHPKRRHPNWGGRRPGSGAPKGNLNAFLHGRYSTQQRDLARILGNIPEARDAMIRLANRRRARDKKEELGANLLLSEILQRIGETLINPDNHLENNQELAEKLLHLESLLTQKTKKAKNEIKRARPQSTKEKTGAPAPASH